MTRHAFLLAGLGTLLLPALLSAAEPTGDEFFEKEVRPLLIDRCQKCHGDKDPKGGLRLLSRAGLLKGGDTGPAVVPGEPEKSLLVKLIQHVEKPKMPPKEKLPDRDIATLTRWVKIGAPWPGGLPVPVTDDTFRITEAQRKHWAYQPVKAVAPPAVKDHAWPKGGIDKFILARLESENLTPAKAADKRTLLRRAAFDLHGLPPTPEEIDAFVKDETPRAFETVIDRLLASRRYGERWGRHWLDGVRYCDSADARDGNGGFSEAWRYRDWVIDAVNRDLPYDRFLTDQLAGDLLPGPEPAKPNYAGLTATGMLVIGNWGGGDADKEKLLTDIVDDQIDVVGRTFMGLTLACARCHNHKFDALSTADYYGLAGIFFSTNILPNVGPKTNGPPINRIPLGMPEEVAMRRDFAKQVAELEKQLNTAKGDKGEIQRSLNALNALRPPPLPEVHAAQEGGVPGSPHAGIHDVRVHIRGGYDRLGSVVPRRFPTILAGEQQSPLIKGSGRLELAQWLTRPEHPLTARVMVNRLWQHHFGAGIVRTPSNFGDKGERPTHPELLDYLADQFTQSGWSMKAMHKAMMLSAVYQQESKPSPHGREIDPENRLLGHMNRRRLEAEAVRDNLLAVAGRLSDTRGGKAVTDVNDPRRTLYLATVRSDRSGFGALFDAADSTALVDKRTISTVAPQALFLLNHPFALSQARAFAKRVAASGPDDGRRVETAYLLLYGRPPSDAEARIGRDFVKAGGASAWDDYCHVLLCANEFIYVD